MKSAASIKHPAPARARIRVGSLLVRVAVPPPSGALCPHKRMQGLGAAVFGDEPSAELVVFVPPARIERILTCEQAAKSVKRCEQPKKR